MDCSHVFARVQQRRTHVRYYDHYSNLSRGRRKKAQTDDQIPYVLEPVESLKVERPELSPKELRKNWARLIQKIYEVDPLTWPKCRGLMRVIAFIENEDVVKKILRHLGLWEVKRKPLPRANAPPIDAFPAYEDHPVPCADDYIRDPQYPADAYF
jgi:hypothetical protein